MSSESGASIASEYAAADAELRVRYSKVGNVLALALMPMGVSLDYFVYPQFVGAFFTVRLLSDIVLGAIFAAHFFAAGRRQIRALAIAWALTVQFAIAFMIYKSEGAVSPYYAGLNMVTLAVAVLSPWTIGETLFVCVVTMAAYLCACVAHGEISGQWGKLFNNIYFIILTDLICVVSSYFTSRSRFEDFRLRHELNLKNRDLAEADRLKSEFFANISHEFRTPLTLIIAPIDEILRSEEKLPGPARESLVLIRDNSLRLLKLISDLLELVRLQDGRTQVKRERIELATFVPAMVDSVRHLAVMKGLKIKTSDVKGPLHVIGDTGRLEKVILNILTNALKFTPAGGSIDVRCSQSNGQSNEWALVEFQDTGVGIPEAELPYIFDRFRQVDGSSTRKYHGAGIGLTIARELVQEQGGRLSATSALGKGTTFKLELPLATAAAASAAPAAAGEHSDDVIADIYRRSDRTLAHASDATALPEVGAGDFTILVIEDEPDMRKFLVASLESKFRLIQAADGRQGLELAKVKLPDLVLVDLMLPEMNGLEVCSALKSTEATRHIRVVLLTARGDERSRLAALERGADDFLTKPFSTLELKTRLENLLASSRLERRLRDRNLDLERTLTQLKETEAQLVQSEKLGAVGSLSAGLLHEINNPLNFMLVAIQLAQEAAPDGHANLKETLNDIENGLLRINDIISDLRTFAYPDRATNLQPVALKDVITGARRLTSHELKATKIEVKGDQLQVLASKTQLMQVLINLLLNAAWATQRRAGHSPEISICAEVQNNRVVVKVRDNGIGIAPDKLQKIFEPFYTTKPVGGGMGLGLSVCHTIIKNHGGELKATSELEKWTEMQFDLALAQAEGIRENEHEKVQRL